MNMPEDLNVYTSSTLLTTMPMAPDSDTGLPTLDLVPISNHPVNAERINIGSSI